MRHALALFSFCLLLPQAALACMPIHASSGTQGFYVLLSWMLSLIYLVYFPIAFVRMRRMPAGAPGYAKARRKMSLSWRLGLVFVVLPILTTVEDLLATLLVASVTYALSWAACVTVKLAIRRFKSVGFNRVPPAQTEEWVTANADYLHFSKTVGKKSFLTRRLAAVGDVQ